jgi:pSer/pThr/pTyr-binding forkhead associated (FHA) protein
MATICLLNEDGTVVQHWELGDKPLAFGRGTAVDVKIDDDGVSRRHFIILREGEDYLLRDLSSRNGTWVDGSRAATTRLRHNDRILAGRTQFRFSENEERNGRKHATGPHETAILPSCAVNEMAADL